MGSTTVTDLRLVSDNSGGSGGKAMSPRQPSEEFARDLFDLACMSRLLLNTIEVARDAGPIEVERQDEPLICYPIDVHAALFAARQVRNMIEDFWVRYEARERT
jgi:hypothetical protein